MFSRFFTIIVLCGSTIITVGCGSSNPVLTIQSTPVVTKSGNATLENVQRTIISACARRGWQPKVAGNGHIIATLQQTGHIVTVDITFTAQSYSISYNDSSNMNYDGTKINPLYNDWVKALDKEIRAKLSRL